MTFTPTGIPCPFSSQHLDTNDHLGLCPSLRTSLQSNLSHLKKILHDSMASHLPDPNSIKFIIDSITRLPLFATINNNTHDVYLLIHQLVPQDLYNMIYSNTHKHNIWIPHNDKLHAWERARNILRKDKRKRPQLPTLDSSKKLTSARIKSRVRINHASSAPSLGLLLDNTPFM
ncbi:unnamed protein product [Rhizophagus irregularis]|uniref:Uncharacterized protein n=1 Tax=Rhizophagus irregularis TaxID=588596 RepID=A0A915Z097_9GLOM|nr:unnamed protein product [Rhizophagus irregularis]